MIRQPPPALRGHDLVPCYICPNFVRIDRLLHHLQSCHRDEFTSSSQSLDTARRDVSLGSSGYFPGVNDTTFDSFQDHHSQNVRNSHGMRMELEQDEEFRTGYATGRRGSRMSETRGGENVNVPQPQPQPQWPPPIPLPTFSRSSHPPPSYAPPLFSSLSSGDTQGAALLMSLFGSSSRDTTSDTNNGNNNGGGDTSLNTPANTGPIDQANDTNTNTHNRNLSLPISISMTIVRRDDEDGGNGGDPRERIITFANNTNTNMNDRIDDDANPPHVSSDMNNVFAYLISSLIEREGGVVDGSGNNYEANMNIMDRMGGGVRIGVSDPDAVSRMLDSDEIEILRSSGGTCAICQCPWDFLLRRTDGCHGRGSVGPFNIESENENRHIRENGHEDDDYTSTDGSSSDESPYLATTLQVESAFPRSNITPSASNSVHLNVIDTNHAANGPNANDVNCSSPPPPQAPRRVERCGHTFCDACILAWLRLSKYCPVCRVELENGPVSAVPDNNA